jgi:predicted ester cyclase
VFAAFFAALDLHGTPEFLIAEGDMVVTHDAYQAKHNKGAFQGIPPTGKEATFTGSDIYRIVKGKIVEGWFEADATGVMQQLGVLPTPGQIGR